MSVHSKKPAPDRTWKRQRRSRTLTMRELRRLARNETRPLDPAEAEAIRAARPRTRAECIDGPRPCPWVSCRYNLYLDVNPATGSVKLNFPEREIHELEETCTLDVADKGPVTLDRIGEMLDLTRERVRQLEHEGIEKLRRTCRPPSEE